MVTIITTTIGTIGTIIVAIFSYLTHNKIEKMNELKKSFQRDIEERMAESDKADKEIIKQIQDLKKVVDFNDIDAVRNRIVSFELRCRADKNNNAIRLHEYKTYFKDRDKWKMYHKIYKELNGEIDIAINYIDEHYKHAKFDNEL